MDIFCLITKGFCCRQHTVSNKHASLHPESNLLQVKLLEKQKYRIHFLRGRNYNLHLWSWNHGLFARGIYTRSILNF